MVNFCEKANFKKIYFVCGKVKLTKTIMWYIGTFSCSQTLLVNLVISSMYAVLCSLFSVMSQCM